MGQQTSDTTSTRQQAEWVKRLTREQRRYETASRVLAGMMANPHATVDTAGGMLGLERARTAVALADALLAALDEERA